MYSFAEREDTRVMDEPCLVIFCLTPCSDPHVRK